MWNLILKKNPWQSLAVKRIKRQPKAAQYFVLEFNSLKNPLAAFGCQKSRGTPKHHLAAKGCPEFVVESNTKNLRAVKSHVAYYSFVGRISNILIFGHSKL